MPHILIVYMRKGEYAYSRFASIGSLNKRCFVWALERNLRVTRTHCMVVQVVQYNANIFYVRKEHSFLILTIYGLAAALADMQVVERNRKCHGCPLSSVFPLASNSCFKNCPFLPASSAFS